MTSYSDASVTGGAGVGGLVGDGNGTIRGCYTTGAVHASVSGVGGLVGNYNGSIESSYATGFVTGANAAGGLVGAVNASASINDSYYDKETSGQNDTGKGNGVTTSELQALIENGTLSGIKYDPQIISFQVGIESSSSSQIAIDTAFNLNVSSLRGIGLGGNFLGMIDILASKVGSKQIDFGAAENRLESALEEISTQYDNLVSSRSTLRDADIAEVSSEYIRQQILQQASATLMATANQSPALALQLI